MVEESRQSVERESSVVSIHVLLNQPRHNEALADTPTRSLEELFECSLGLAGQLC
jgi:hypothetical protein